MASNVPSQLLILATASVGAAALAGCKAEATSSAGARPQTVETVTVRFEPAVQTWSYVGTVKPRYQSDLGFRVAGKITARLVEVGGVVKRVT
jgi:multidrug efflux pump subunit AcrA (membrane-fusion protein)